ncbi:MAG: helix-turn-helix transcriptional regulator [Lachnospiraceae bacterium]|nr:helix-turn-helix transcriptional regulator [Lachnospiraceae bacterium]
MLTENEWKTINNILLELYTIEDLKELSEKTLSLMQMLIRYDSGYLVLLDDDQKIEPGKSYFTGFEKRAENDYIKQYYEEDYLHYLFGFTKETCVFQDTDILNREIRENTNFYRKFLIPAKLVYGTGILLIRGERLTGIFNLFRNQEMGDFSKRDIFILNILKNHIENMVYRTTQMNRASTSVRRNLIDFAGEHKLTGREADVLGLINKGYSNQEIADELFISLSTVKKHIYNIFSKTGAQSRGQLISLFLRTAD